MKMSILLIDELRKRIKKKLLSDYILFAGDLEAIGNLEEQVYTPGTEKNVLFEAYMSSCAFGMGFTLGKRTKELKDFLHLPDFDKTLCVIFGEKINEKENGKVEYIVQQIYINPKKSMEYSVNAFVNNVIL